MQQVVKTGIPGVYLLRDTKTPSSCARKRGLQTLLAKAFCVISWYGLLGCFPEKAASGSVAATPAGSYRAYQFLERSCTDATTDAPWKVPCNAPPENLSPLLLTGVRI